uniref:Ig-like domain-containing protein n=1 Tax=Oreochromis aureus TaxID=47969 RepID=A0AAZ1XNW4_OREAU
MQRLFILTLSLIPWIPAVLCWVSIQKEITGLEGGSLTVQCRYGSHHANHVKYWCHGGTREFCEILARTDGKSRANQNKVSISDNRDGFMFTVTMNNLKEKDSGWYWCGVEIASWADDLAFTQVKVIHGVSVVNSTVSGEEGSSLTVQCLYTQRFRLSEKKWCRSGDLSSCLSTGSKGSYEDGSVAISDDRKEAFNVTLKKLQMSDAGWYSCSAGQQQVDVRVQVRPHGSTILQTDGRGSQVSTCSGNRARDNPTYSESALVPLPLHVGVYSGVFVSPASSGLGCIGKKDTAQEGFFTL